MRKEIYLYLVIQVSAAAVMRISGWTGQARISSFSVMASGGRLLIVLPVQIHDSSEVPCELLQRRLKI